ncbi:MAG: GxxExxY protein [Phycisphaeraceae bacterium]|nr:GxxExxY protein [Phycisphaeraceae bacterium]
MRHEGTKATKRKEVYMEPMKTLDEQLESLAHRVIGAAIEVHRTLGPGFLESVYEKALSHELQLYGIRHACQVPVKVNYKGVEVGEGRIDILVEDQIVIERKCADDHHAIFESQLISYLKAADLRLGYLMNFKSARLKDGIQRIIL